MKSQTKETKNKHALTSNRHTDNFIVFFKFLTVYEHFCPLSGFLTEFHSFLACLIQKSSEKAENNEIFTDILKTCNKHFLKWLLLFFSLSYRFLNVNIFCHDDDV